MLLRTRFLPSFPAKCTETRKSVGAVLRTADGDLVVATDQCHEPLRSQKTRVSERCDAHRKHSFLHATV